MEEVVGWNSSSQITLSYFCNTNFPFVLFSAAANFRPSPTSSSATTTSASLTATTRSTRTCRPSWTPSTRTCRRWTASWTTCRRAARSTWWESGVSRGLILELPSVKSVHKLCSSSEALQRLLLRLCPHVVGFLWDLWPFAPPFSLVPFPVISLSFPVSKTTKRPKNTFKKETIEKRDNKLTCLRLLHI